MDYTTLAAVKSYGTIERDVKDTIIENSFIPTASRRIDEFCGQKFGPQVFDQTVCHVSQIGMDGFLRAWLPSPIVQTLTKLEYRRLPAYTTWQEADLTLADIENRQIGAIVRVYANLFTYRGDGLQVRLTGTVGYADLAVLPETIQHACVRLVHWFLHQPDAPFGKAGNMLTGEWEVPPGMPSDVENSLGPWKRVT